MKKAVIDLDWLDEQIDTYKVNLSLCSTESYDYWSSTLNTFKLIRFKCTPIEEPKTECFPHTRGILTTLLPPTCIQEWESAKYCQNERKCKLCETK